MKTYEGIDRRRFVALSSNALAFANTRARAAQGGLGELFSLTVFPWAAENPRNDHQQIFPLKDGRLLLVRSEYYVNRP